MGIAIVNNIILIFKTDYNLSTYYTPDLYIILEYKFYFALTYKHIIRLRLKLHIL